MLYNVILRVVRANIFAVEKLQILQIVNVCFVAFGVQHAMHMRHIFVCGLSRSTVFFHPISQTARLKKY